MKDRKTGQPRGFGFITYADPSVVDTVIEDTHIINSKQVTVNTCLLIKELFYKDKREMVEARVLNCLVSRWRLSGRYPGVLLARTPRTLERRRFLLVEFRPL